MSDAEIIERIYDYWRERGYVAEIGMRRCVCSNPASGNVWTYQAVRSDLRSGLPRGYRGPLARGQRSAPNEAQPS